jgi:hypothetical protein
VTCKRKFGYFKLCKNPCKRIIVGDQYKLRGGEWKYSTYIVGCKIDDVLSHDTIIRRSRRSMINSKNIKSLDYLNEVVYT